MAHRGDHRTFTENTLEAFEQAVDLGFGYIESDIHATADGVAVLAHDPDLRRIAGRAEVIQELTWSELAEITLPCGAGFGRLDEALRSFPDIRFNLDAKAQSSVWAMAKALIGHQERVCVGSFSHSRNQQLRALLPKAAHSASPREMAGIRIGLKMDADAAMIPTHAGPIPLASRFLIERLHAMGHSVHIWTVNRPSEMHQLLKRGVDGLMTDEPHTLKEVFMERGIW